MQHCWILLIVETALASCLLNIYYYYLREFLENKSLRILELCCEKPSHLFVYSS